MTKKESISQKDYDLAITLLSNDKLSDVLELLEEDGIDIVQQKARYVREKKEYRANRMSHSEYSVSRSRTNQAIQELVNDLIIEKKPMRSKGSKDEPNTQKNVLNHNTITSAGDLNLHTGDLVTHNHFYQGQPIEPEIKVNPKASKDNPNVPPYINKISDSFIFKLEKFLVMSSEYQYSFSNPEYRVLSFLYLEELVSKLKIYESQLDDMDIELFSYTRKLLNLLKAESKTINGLKSVLTQSNLKTSHLFSLSTRVLSNFIDTIDKIEGNEMDANDGALFLDEKRQILIEELTRIKKMASNYSLN